jgi:hypothetical protein
LEKKEGTKNGRNVHESNPERGSFELHSFVAMESRLFNHRLLQECIDFKLEYILGSEDDNEAYATNKRHESITNKKKFFLPIGLVAVKLVEFDSLHCAFVGSVVSSTDCKIATVFCFTIHLRIPSP